MLKGDIDHVISTLTTKPPSYHLAQTQKGNKKIQEKINFSASKIGNYSTSLTHPLLNNSVKILKNDLKTYISKVGQPQDYG